MRIIINYPRYLIENIDGVYILRKLFIIIPFLFIGLLPAEDGLRESYNQEAMEYSEEDEEEEELELNYSANLYLGYPVYVTETFSYYDKTNPIFGLSIGTPLGFQAGPFYATVDIEILRYIFEGTEASVDPNYIGRNFGGMAYQVGVNTGLFFNEFSFSITAASGIYEEESDKKKTGFIGGVNLDLPLGDMPIEIRLATRANMIQKSDGITGWVGGGISLGYEF